MRRMDQESYRYFVNMYLVCVLCHGKSKNLKYDAPSDVFSVSNETMVIWFLENSWERWEDMKLKEDKNKSEVETLYTVLGDKGGSKKFGGWNEKGKRGTIPFLMRLPWRDVAPLERPLMTIIRASKTKWLKTRRGKMYLYLWKRKKELSEMDWLR